MPTTRPPRAGHHIQWIGSLPNRSSVLYNAADKPEANAPLNRPAMTHETRDSASGAAVSSGNSGPVPKNAARAKPATAQAKATGRKLRGRHSNSNNSTASSTAATGVPNPAVIPAAAPATSSVLRSAEVTFTHWAISEPSAPPVMMIGPSAPNGPPLPITTPEGNA